MKKVNLFFKFFVFTLFVLAIATSCIKSEEPTTEYSASTETSQTNQWIQSMITSGLNIDTTATGIYYIVDKKGTGPTVKAGNTVTVKYASYLLDGTAIDYSDAYTFVHRNSTTPLIPGFNEALDIMSKGELAVFLIPSSKAYGITGYGAIPPYSALLYYIEVDDIK